jgi:hypothetical protein
VHNTRSRQSVLACWRRQCLAHGRPDHDVGGAAHAQQPRQQSSAGGIYSCTDARGRTLTADRPIAECSDREQRELSPSGLTRRKVEPTYTAREMAEREDRAREAAVQAAPATDERRRERALLMRYPNPHARPRAQ